MSEQNMTGVPLILRPLAAAGRIFWHLLEQFASFLRHLSRMGELMFQTGTRTPLLFKNINLTLHQMYILGVESLSLVIVTSVFVGGEAVIQCNYQFNGFVPLKYLGMAVSKALLTELCPVITAFVVSGRVATSIASEIASMKMSEQLDAMRCLSLDSIRYLIVPKAVACIIMLPVLTAISLFVAFAASVIAAVSFIDISLHLYLAGLKMFFIPWDLLGGVVKTAVFGGIIAFVGAHFGFESQKGAHGVGEATTRSVMVSAMLILIFDFVIALVLR